MQQALTKILGLMKKVMTILTQCQLNQKSLWLKDRPSQYISMSFHVFLQAKWPPVTTV